jgi:quercetin dioxygenase-like cupin family protein
VQKYNIYSAKTKNVNSSYFTGSVVIKEVLGEGNSGEQEMYHVTFHNGALTTAHYHESDQILIATNGEGVVGLMKEGISIGKSQVDNNSIFFLKEGDTVCIPAYKLHFHGAIRGKNFSHIAIMKMYKSNKEQERAITKWQYDLMRQDIRNKEEKNPEGVIKTMAKGIGAKIQIAILQKLKQKKKNNKA